MKAIRLHGQGGPDHLVYEDAPQPHPGLGEVLVRVYATGVIASELKWDVTYQTKAGSPRALPIPGRDLSGVVEEVGHVQIGTVIDAGHIRPIVETVLPLSEARQAYEQGAKGHARGGIVLRIVDE
jgi:NADPH:quinone reductase-like Zn-dependent oxidoreductase